MLSIMIFLMIMKRTFTELVEQEEQDVQESLYYLWRQKSHVWFQILSAIRVNELKK